MPYRIVQRGNDYLVLVKHHFQNYEWGLAEQTLTAALDELAIITEIVVPNKELIPVGYLGGGYGMENGSFFILGSTTLHYPYTFPEGKVTVEITAHSQNEKGESPIMVSGIGNNYSPIWKVDSWPYEVFSFTVETTGNEQDFTIRFPWDNQINDRITAKNGENWKLLLYIDQVKFIIETTEIP